MSEESKVRKQQVIDEIADKIEKSNSLVVIDYIGITVAEADALRNKLRDANVDYKVYKNTLVKRAIAGTDSDQLSDILEGPSAFAFGYEDSTAPARALDAFIKEVKKMQFKAGIIDGVFYDAAGIGEIAKIPPRDELIAKFMGSIQSPLSKLVRTFAAIAEAGDAGGEAEGTVTADAPAEAAADAADDAADAADTVTADAPAEAAAEAESEAGEAGDAATDEVPAEAAEPAEAQPEGDAAAEEAAEAAPAEAEAEAAEADSEEAGAETAPESEDK
jgi:large subunit ribosomal protein L10